MFIRDSGCTGVYILYIYIYVFKKPRKKKLKVFLVIGFTRVDKIHCNIFYQEKKNNISLVKKKRINKYIF